MATADCMVSAFSCILTAQSKTFSYGKPPRLSPFPTFFGSMLIWVVDASYRGGLGEEPATFGGQTGEQCRKRAAPGALVECGHHREPAVTSHPGQCAETRILAFGWRRAERNRGSRYGGKYHYRCCETSATSKPFDRVRSPQRSPEESSCRGDPEVAAHWQ